MNLKVRFDCPNCMVPTQIGVPGEPESHFCPKCRRVFSRYEVVKRDDFHLLKPHGHQRVSGLYTGGFVDPISVMGRTFQIPNVPVHQGDLIAIGITTSGPSTQIADISGLTPTNTFLVDTGTANGPRTLLYALMGVSPGYHLLTLSWDGAAPIICAVFISRITNVSLPDLATTPSAVLAGSTPGVPDPTSGATGSLGGGNHVCLSAIGYGHPNEVDSANWLQGFQPGQVVDIPNDTLKLTLREGKRETSIADPVTATLHSSNPTVSFAAAVACFKLT